ncbi:MAG: YchJ family metal-binding protein [Thermodesulfobacteriota bacterium]|nr:YchJ family metal-binding protein [Thermodesulfobacteriota bacterium]
MNTKEQCPCCSGELFTHCCAPILRNQSKAETAEQLMRSRYTAFTLADNTYLLDSWSSETRPEEMKAEEDSIQWLGLDVEEHEQGGKDDEEGSVTFTASFLSSGHLCHLHEISRFVKFEGLWYYLDGKAESKTQKVGRNEACPCGSGKKYKKCCC